MDIERIVEEVTKKVIQELDNDISTNLLSSLSTSNYYVPNHVAEQKHDSDKVPSISEVKNSLEYNTTKINQGIASIIDHTLLTSDVTKEDIHKLCQEAINYNFASVCINPTWVELCSKLIANSSVKVCTVIGFPLGATSPEAKAYETTTAINQGADEIDMVINVGALRAKDYKLVHDDIKGVVCAAGNKIVKVILETASLNHNEKIIGCVLAKSAGADFVKTSTGFGKGGATVEDVALMRETVGHDIGVKASGGVRSIEDVQKMVQAGATRIGASSSVAIVTGKTAKGSY